MGMLSDAMGEMVGEITDLKQKLNKLQREYDHEKSFVHYLKKKHCEDLEALRQGKCSEQEYRRGYSAGHEEGYN